MFRPLLAALAILAVALFAPFAAAAETMQALRYAAFGPADVLQIDTVPRPAPGPGELLVRVHAAGVNPIDAALRAGHGRGFIDVELPYVPGFDFSGEIAALGAGVEGLGLGDAVFGMVALTRGGTHAGYVVVKPEEVARKPVRASHTQAAALPLVGLTAWQALIDTAGLAAGQTVLIHAGAGGVGSAAIQLAKARGARVIATASEANLDFLRELGADLAIDYRNQRFEEYVDAVDVVLDPIGGETQQRSLAVLKDGGVLVSLVGLGPAANNPPRGIRALAILVQPNAEQLGQLAALVDAGELRPEVSLTLPLSRAAEAHRQIETRRTRGKVVLRIGE
jgi:NADPH:quinone reductase-like Zn-dependent oxidoreductase